LSNEVYTLTPQVLLIDDDTDLLDLFQIFLRRTPITVLRAEGGTRALEMLANITPDLVVLDVAMPDVTGIDVLRYIRAEQRLAKTKVILLTAAPVLVERDIADASTLVLVKPIVPSTLDQQIRQMLGL
jgi:DNA-binding response OmpR family regulator